jgi:hypothetical protein
MVPQKDRSFFRGQGDGLPVLTPPPGNAYHQGEVRYGFSKGVEDGRFLPDLFCVDRPCPDNPIVQGLLFYQAQPP